MTVITIIGKGITFDGITFAPKNNHPDFDGHVPAELMLWSDEDSVQVEVTDDAVFVTSEVADTISKFASTVTRTTTCYRCPVIIRNCSPDFSVFDNSDTDEYVPSPGVLDYGMFSDEGNLAVQAALDAAYEADNMVTVADVQAMVEGHPEVNDTVVREKMYAVLEMLGLIREDA